MTHNNYPLLMTEEFWANSQLSIARYYGRIRFDGREYYIVNKEGKDLRQCSREAEKAGRTKAIEPGEPADLVLKSLIPAYKRLGRDKIISLIKEGKTEKEIKEIAKQLKTDNSKLTTDNDTDRPRNHQQRQLL